MTPDELKSLPKGTFIVTKTGFYPIKVKLKLFFKWGIEFEKTPYVVPLRDNSTIKYASKQQLVKAIKEKYPPKDGKKEKTEGDASTAIIVESTMGEQVMVKAKGPHQRIWNGKEHQGASSK